MTLAILDVVGDPPLAFSVAGSAGDAMTAYLFSGRCRIGDTPNEKLSKKLAGGSRIARLGFYVPQAGPFRPSYLLSAWAEVSLAKAELAVTGLSQGGSYGVDDAEVQLMEDDFGRGGQWPYLWFTAYGGEPMVIRYRLTVVQPVG